MKQFQFFAFIPAIAAFTSCTEAENRLPNIVIIYADDLGWGDVECYDDRCQIPTPNINKLAYPNFFIIPTFALNDTSLKFYA